MTTTGISDGGMVERDDWTRREQGLRRNQILVPKRAAVAEKRIPKHEYETSDAYQHEPNSRLTLA